MTTQEPTYTETGIERRFCTLCGKLLDERTLPVHVAGDWVVVKEPTYGDGGLKQKSCTVCGKVLEEEKITPLIPVASCKLDHEKLDMTYKSSARLSAEVLPENAANTDLIWTSSDTSVATVDDQGNVTAAGQGSAVITCASADGNASSSSVVVVQYTLWQRIIVVVLFGWIWY